MIQFRWDWFKIIYLCLSVYFKAIFPIRLQYLSSTFCSAFRFFFICPKINWRFLMHFGAFLFIWVTHPSFQSRIVSVPSYDRNAQITGQLQKILRRGCRSAKQLAVCQVQNSGHILFQEIFAQVVEYFWNTGKKYDDSWQVHYFCDSNFWQRAYM